jgi:hypothetical protein
MAKAIEIKPSSSARQLFNQMVARAGEDLHLSMDATLTLAVERKRAGHQDGCEIQQLEQEEWIDQSKDGGWLLH